MDCAVDLLGLYGLLQVVFWDVGITSLAICWGLLNFESVLPFVAIGIMRLLCDNWERATGP